MFDINKIIDNEIYKAYNEGRRDVINEIFRKLSTYNSKENKYNYIEFVEQLINDYGFDEMIAKQ